MPPTAHLRAGADTSAGRRMFAMLREAGLVDVRFRPLLVGFTHAGPMADFLPGTAASSRGAIVRVGIITNAERDAAIEACRCHLAHPGTTSTSVTVFQVWGRKPR